MKPIGSCPPDSNCPKVLPRSLCPPTKGDQTVAPPSAAAAAAKASGGDATEGPFISPFARGKDENAGLDEAKATLILAKRRQAARAVFGSAFDKRQEKDEQVLLVDRKQDPRKVRILGNIKKSAWYISGGVFFWFLDTSRGVGRCLAVMRNC